MRVPLGALGSFHAFGVRAGSCGVFCAKLCRTELPSVCGAMQIGPARALPPRIHADRGGSVTGRQELN